MKPDTWSGLGRVAPEDLFEARLALHYAAQPIAAAAYALLPMREDHSHTNILWSAVRGEFAGRTLGCGHRVFLEPARLRIGLRAVGGEEVGASELADLNLEQAFAELATLLGQMGEEVPAGGLKLPDYDLPESPLARSGTFACDAPALQELARWFHDADLVLSRAAGAHLDGAEVRGWPHHFDLAALRTLDAGKDPESARSVGAGFSPGDGSYAEPYFYVSPWPYPEPGQLPELPAGAHWHTEGFTAAVLPGSAIVSREDPAGQESAAQEFLRAAITSSLAVLEN